MIEVISVSAKKNAYHLELKVGHELKSLEVSDEIILTYRLVKGKILDQESYKALNESIMHDKYRQKLWHYVSFKPRTVHEARLYLSQFDMPEKAKTAYIAKLKDAHMLDDERYVKQYIDEYSHFRMIGPRKIIQDLRNKGIEQDLINRHIGLYAQSLMRENISRLIEKKVKSLKNKPLVKVKESIKGYILNKGYDYDLIDSVMAHMEKEILASNDEDAAIQKDFDQYIRKYKKSNQSHSFKAYVLPKLMQKGYPYHKIIQLLEGEEIYED